MPMIDGSSVTVLDWSNINKTSAPSPAEGPSSVLGSSPVNKVDFADVAAAVANQTPRNSSAPAATVSTPSFKFWEKENLSFGDFVDIINPLQHIPIVATLYRNLTGDQIGAVPRVIGGALWGRVGGLVTGIANAVVQWFTGKDIGDHIYTALFKPAPNVKESTVVQSHPNEAPKVDSISSTGITPAGQSRNSTAPQPTESRSENLLPWPAASALHIFQKHHQLFDPDDNSDGPILRYVA